MNTAELLSSLKIKQVFGTLPNEITTIHNDSREAEDNSIFICTRGFTVDSHDFYQQAIENGASLVIAEKKLDIDLDKAALVIVNDTYKATAILANRFYGYPSTKLNLFGVTGTNGKTTVTNLIHSMLKKGGRASALSGTIGVQLDNKQLPSSNTTCDALTNQKILKNALDQDIDHMAMEVSSHGLAQGRLWGVDFDVVTFTNLTHDHLDYHDTMEQYGYAKGLLFAQLGQDLRKTKYAVLNHDDAWFDTYKSVSAAEVISYSLNADSDFKAENVEYHPDKTTFTLLCPEGRLDVTMNLLGEFNVYNALAAIASLYAYGIPAERLVKYIGELPPVNGRMEKVDMDAPVSMYIDYAHTPDAIEKSIDSVLPFKKNRLIFMVGTGGDRDEYKRPAMAEKASRADYVILTINDPRFEKSEDILRDMEKGMKHDNYALVADRKEAISHALQVSEPDDILIFAGKGQEDYQIIEDTKYPHSDRKIVEEQCLLRYSR
ncbi:UDP-N-acetylmuramoyl-L-alanyl-D-glutamate--2,6-diaminopimelate ligase [Sediminibacillus albus]|uniref:UDP-N-acetylmuramyl-tripeptide synthetase n=1 Tax=Sediminibacillus albus TaxID=407036 RepID=A0A1G9B7F2_9BACI|nr:UDP-N-acetylmuramoyl-L-alanyl-D-glutamate--2,6-diaminopimelate ligase [Sediminibacillus albus]SDK35398.1 UDP-N-acetylmuramoyl-L-alanyl-D-glutamate-L-lysine ligase [Sediminibacillus albus]